MNWFWFFFVHTSGSAVALRWPCSCKFKRTLPSFLSVLGIIFIHLFFILETAQCIIIIIISFRVLDVFLFILLFLSLALAHIE